MRIPHIHTRQPLAAGLTVELEASPARHLAQVLRLRAGARVTLFNGDGLQYSATLQTCSRQRVSAHILSATQSQAEPPLHFRLALGISKGERMDYALQKAVELGVGSFLPLFTERTVVKLKGERLERRQRHWQQVAVAAAEQSGRSCVPAIEPPQPFDDWISRPQPGLRLTLHPGAEQSLRALAPPERSVLLLVGPEGGLSEREVAAARTHGFVAVRLGPRILRTETAPVAALAAMQALWGDFG